MLSGNLNSTDTWDRTFGIPTADSFFNNVGYEIFQFTFDANDSDVEVEVTSGSFLLNTTMYFFESSWDVTDPLGPTNAANARVYDDNDGAIFLSAVGSSFGDAPIAVTAGTVYGVIVSGFSFLDQGNFEVTVRSTANISAVPEPGSIATLIGLAGLFTIRRRRS